MPISSLIYAFTAEMLSLTRIIMKIYVQHVLQIGQCVRLFVTVQGNILHSAPWRWHTDGVITQKFHMILFHTIGRKMHKVYVPMLVQF